MARIGLSTPQYGRLPPAERRVFDDWLKSIDAKDWCHFEILNEAGSLLQVTRYLRNDAGNRYIDPNDRHKAAWEIVLIDVPTPPPVLRLLED